MVDIELRWPVADVDFELESLGRFTVRYLPNCHLLQWPDRRGGFGGPGLTVERFSCPNPGMLRRDLLVRIKLVECGFSFEDICALDGADMSDTMLTAELRTRMNSSSRHQFDRRMAEHEESMTEDEPDPFTPVGSDSSGESDTAMEDRPISIINYQQDDSEGRVI